MQGIGEILDPENSDPEDQGCLTELMYDLIDEMSLGMSFEVHRAAKIGTLFLDETDLESQKQYELVNERGLDIFGQVPTKKQYECVCPSCGRNLAAARFAPHLEKCMGMGRNSSRIASRRIANATQKKESGDESDEHREDEWNADRKAKKMKAEKKSNNNHSKKGKSTKVKNGDSQNQGANETLSIYESMTLEEKKALLMSTCGVISEHTKKMCTKSLRCPQHTELQRRAVRSYLLRQPSCLELDEHVDIDTYNEEDGQCLVQTLQWEAVSNPSPADSSSTTGSTSKKRKHGKTSSKKKNTKSDSSVKGSRSDTPVKVLRSESPAKGLRSDSPSKLSPSGTPTRHSRGDTPSKLLRSETPSKLTRVETPSKLSRSSTPNSSQELT